MSAKEVDTTTFIPKSDKAQGACSREEPQPKLSPATNILESRYASLFKTKSSTSDPSDLYLISANALTPRPERLMVFRNCFGIIISVSIFTNGIGAAIPLNFSNFSIKSSPARQLNVP